MCDQPPDKILDFYAVKDRHRMLSITGPWRPNKLLNNLFARADSAIDFTSRKKTILILACEDGSKKFKPVRDLLGRPKSTTNGHLSHEIFPFIKTSVYVDFAKRLKNITPQ